MTLFVVLSTISIVSLATVNIYRGTADMRNDLLRLLESEANAHERAIELQIRDYYISLRLIASRTAMRRNLLISQNSEQSEESISDAHQAVERIVQDVVAVEPLINNVTIYDLAGDAVVSEGDFWVALIDQEHIQLPDQEQFVGFINLDGTPLAQLATPLYYNGELIGAIQLFLDAKRFIHLLKTAEALGPSAEAVLAWQNIRGETTLLAPRRHYSNQPQILPTKNIKFPMPEALKGIEGVFDNRFVDYTGDHILAALRHIPDGQLGLVVKISKDELDRRRLMILVTNLVIGFSMLVITLISGWLASRWLLMPLERITNYARSFGVGNRDPLPVEGRDEFGLLAKTINEASQQILERESRLAIMEERQRAVLEHMLDAVFTINRHGTIQYCNAAAARLFGYEVAELLGKNVNILMPEPDAKSHDQYIHHHLTTGEKRVIGIGREVVGLRKDSVEIPLQLAVTRFEVGGETLFAGLLHDLTERKNYELELQKNNQALQEANSELEQFAYITSHDLKSPLRAIDNLVEWIREDLGAIQIPDAVQTNMTRLQERTRTLEKMIQELLNYSRAGRREWVGESVDVRDLVNEVVKALAPPDGFIIRISPELPKFVTFKTPLETIFRNLISNAINHHDREVGEIVIEHVTTETLYCFRLKDDGPGIPPEYQSRIFQIFQTLAPKKPNGGESTGMGLALVKRLLDKHGGNIRVISEVNSRGSCFEFDWPRTTVIDEQLSPDNEVE